MNEAEWMSQVMQLATILGYEYVHFRPGRTAHGWATPVSGPLGKGWPDLILVRPGRRIAAELKAEGKHPSEEQLAVLAALQAAGFEIYVWRPSDLDLVAGILR